MVSSLLKLWTSLGCSPSNSLPIEFHGCARSVHLERSVRSHGVRTNEDPVLPSRQTAEHSCFEGFAHAKAQICLESGKGIWRKRGTRFDGLAHFVLPIEVVRG